MNAIARFKQWFWSEVDRDGRERMLKGKFACPRCGSTDFEFVTNPVFSVNSRSTSATKAMVKCAGGEGGCLMRYIFVSHDFGKTWDPYAPSN